MFLCSLCGWIGGSLDPHTCDSLISEPDESTPQSVRDLLKEVLRESSGSDVVLPLPKWLLQEEETEIGVFSME